MGGGGFEGQTLGFGIGFLDETKVDAAVVVAGGGIWLLAQDEGGGVDLFTGNIGKRPWAEMEHKDIDFLTKLANDFVADPEFVVSEM